MDGWQPEPQRHKRSFTQMSHSATLSPSPIGFMGPASFFSAPRFPPISANDNLERRRAPHPHNSYHQPRASEHMSDRLQTQQQRPRLEHRASQTIIDLTDEPEEMSAPPPPRNAQPRNRSSRPPQLGRSDAVNLGDFIDLTDESVEQDVIFTGERQRPAQPARPRPQAFVAPPAVIRQHSPSLFLPVRHQNHNHAPFGNLRGLMIPQGMGFALGQDPARDRLLQQDFMDQLDLAQAIRQQAMPALNYQHAAFVEQKPEHIPPPKARLGFTRSPKEEDHVLICPSCEQELIQNNEIDETVVTKKSGKAPTKKEREEHPFWVVKECGHVFCNACFQVRTSSAKTGFKETTKVGKKTKAITCAVEDCESDVRAKDKWVGVFL